MYRLLFGRSISHAREQNRFIAKFKGLPYFLKAFSMFQSIRFKFDMGMAVPSEWKRLLPYLEREPGTHIARLLNDVAKCNTHHAAHGLQETFMVFRHFKECSRWWVIPGRRGTGNSRFFAVVAPILLRMGKHPP